MSLQQPGPYQSKIFGAIARQTRRWMDRAHVLLRTLKTAASWSVQILLYPIYVAFQSLRLVGPAVQQAWALSLPELPVLRRNRSASVPPADAPIQQVLQTVQTFLLQTNQLVTMVPSPQRRSQRLPSLAPRLIAPNPAPAMQGHPLALRPTIPASLALLEAPAVTSALLLPERNLGLDELARYKDTDRDAVLLSDAAQPVLTRSESLSHRSPPPTLIQGIATDLATRSLVLVTPDNQILDILTVEQQIQLRQRIIWALASYSRDQRLRNQERKPSARLRPPSAQSRVLKPVRALWQLMAWVQTGTVAIAANLFQEASLLPTPATLPHDEFFWDSPDDYTELLHHSFQQAQLSTANGLSIPLGNATPVAQSCVAPSATLYSAPPVASDLQRLLPDTPNCIETPASLVGYVQTPTAQILRWVDRALVELESLLILLWGKMRAIASDVLRR